MAHSMEDTYEHTRGATEAQRLDQQGYLYSINLGYDLHPSINASLPAVPSIADVGCGTGEFLVRLSRDLDPSSKLIGFDISAQQFQQSLPPNVNLLTADAKQAFAPEFHGQFDVVHLRLLVHGLSEPDWAHVTRNVTQLLKPGGAIQWTEADFPNTKRLRGSVGGSAANLDHLLGTMQAKLMHHYSHGFNMLPQAFRDNGLVSLTQDIVASDRVSSTRKEFAEMNLKACVGWARWTGQDGKRGVWSDTELSRLEALAKEEIATGAYVRYDIYVCIGFRNR